MGFGHEVGMFLGPPESGMGRILMKVLYMNEGQLKFKGMLRK